VVLKVLLAQLTIFSAKGGNPPANGAR